MSSASHRLRRRPRFARQRRNAGLLTVIPHLTRRAPAAAPAPRPPCLTGRCHCRTWGLHTRWTPTGAFAGFDGLRGGAQPGAGPAKAAFGESGSTRIAVVDKDTGQPLGPGRCGHAADIAAVAAGHQRQQPDGRVFGGVQRPGNPCGLNTAADQCIRSDCVHDRGCGQGVFRHVQLHEVQHLPTAGGAGSRRRDW